MFAAYANLPKARTDNLIPNSEETAISPDKKDIMKVQVSTLPVGQIDRVKPWLKKSQQKPNRFLLNDRFCRQNFQGNLDSFWLREISDLLLNGKGEVFIAREESEIVGIVVYTDLPWDTKVIGNKMGSLKYIILAPDSPQQQEIADQLLNQVIEWTVSRDVECLLCKTHSDDVSTVHALERKGFLLTDTLLDYVYNLQKDPLHSIPRPPLYPGCTIRLAATDDIGELMAMARAAFRDHIGRFHSDERITQCQATRVYEEWMRASCQGYADWVLVAEIGGRIAGCSIWKRPSVIEQSLGISLGHYSIGAINPDYKVHGLFSTLTYAGMELFDGIADYIEGPTHINNYPVQRGYTKLHWQICDARHSFHKWLQG